MKTPILLPSVLLLAMFLASLWSGRYLTGEVTQWNAQLQQVDALAAKEYWDDAEELLHQCHSSWTNRQLFLHVMLQHDALDAAEAMYQRAMTFAENRNLPEFAAEIADLSHQLQLLATQEQLQLGNIF